MESGYNVQLDRTCYNINYATESDGVEPGTVLFNITIFVEDRVTGIVLLALPDSEIGLEGIGGSAHSIIITNPLQSVATYSFNIVAGTTREGTNLAIGSYPLLSVRVTLNSPPFQVSPVNLTIYSKQ